MTKTGAQSGYGGHSDEREFACTHCLAEFHTLAASEAHQCVTPPTTPDGLTIASAIIVDQSGPSAQLGGIGQDVTQLRTYHSTVFPGAGPLTNAGDSYRVWTVETGLSDTCGIKSAMGNQFSSGQHDVITTSNSYVFAESRYPGVLANAAVTWYQCSVRAQDPATLEHKTWCVSQTLVGPLIVLHRLMRLLAANGSRSSTPSSLLTFGTCLEDLESFMSLSLELSTTRSQEAAYLTRITSVSLPPSTELGSCMVSLSRDEVMCDMGYQEIL